MRSYIVFILLFFTSFAHAKDIISNKFITKNIVKSYKNEIVIDRNSDDKEDNLWRYNFNNKRINKGISQIDIQIPLIWYHERF